MKDCDRVFAVSVLQPSRLDFPGRGRSEARDGDKTQAEHNQT